MSKTKNTTKDEKNKIKRKAKFKVKHFPCSYCDKTFKERSYRDQHMKLHSSARPFSCELCSHTSKTKKYLAKHVKVVHKPPSKFKCEYCDKMFHYKCILEKHMLVHTNSKPHKCNICDKRFNSTYSLSVHLLIHQNLKPHKCKYCDYACRDTSTLRRHHERHMGIVRRYDCSICDKRFAKKHTLQSHVAESHMNIEVRKHPCDECGKKFKTKKMLTHHVKTVHRKKNATTCDICGLKISNKYNMSIHLLSHVDAKPYKCTFRGCTKRYKDRGTLKKHALIHYPDKQYPCKICGKLFTRRERVRKHEKQHVVKVKSVWCDYCGVSFYNKNYLIVHIRKKHTKKLKLMCDMCDFVTSNKPSLIGHIKKHNRLMRVKKCSICMKQYKRADWLKYHLRHEHNVVEENRTPTLETDVKVEPLDVSALPEFELFEIEKEEVLDELNSINNSDSDDNFDIINQNPETLEAIRVGFEKILQATVRTDAITENSRIELNSDPKRNLPGDGKIVNDTEQLSDAEISQKSSKDFISQQNIALSEDDNISNSVKHTKDAVITEKSNDIDTQHRNELVCSRIDLSSEKTINEERVVVDSNVCNPNSQDPQVLLRKPDAENSKTAIIDSQGTITNENAIDKSTRRKKSRRTKIQASQNSNHSSFNEYIKNIDVDFVNKQGDPCKDNSDKDFNQNKACSEAASTEKTYGPNKNITEKYIRHSKRIQAKNKMSTKTLNVEQDLEIEEECNNKNIKQRKKLIQSKNSTNKVMESSDKEELEQDIEYSNTVLKEDVTRCMKQKKQIGSSEKKLDKFFIEHIFKRQELAKYNKKYKDTEIDKDSEAYVKDYLEKLLKDSRRNKEIKLMEITRKEYNARIRKAKNLFKDKVSIRHFDKKHLKQNNDNEVLINDSVSEDIEGNKIQNDKPINDNNIPKHGDGHTEIDIQNASNNEKDKNVDFNIHDLTDDIKDCDSSTQERDDNSHDEGGNETTIEELHSSSINISNYESTDKDSNDGAKGMKETDRFSLRSASGLKRRRYDVDDMNVGGNENVGEARKMKLNTHQCYVCFKLYDTKDKLIDHCKEHFKVCNSTILKKCPLCDFATTQSIVKHMAKEHDVQISIPNNELCEKESSNGSKYIYKVKSTSIEDIDVIPSVSYLNKQAFVNIDRKNRKLKDTGIAKTKLVKKGNEWVVERNNIKVDNLDDFLLPEFKNDDIMSFKIDSNDYLGRLKKLYRLAKRYKKKMLFPCESCDKICQSLCALKLHCRKHDTESKPFKKKVWKHKSHEFVQPTVKKKKDRRVVEIDKVVENNETDCKKNNRYKKPKPVMNKHKCDPELIKFYETNIKGGDIEFWQFLKIFNKMTKDKVNDFEDLNDRPEFGIHFDKPNAKNDDDENSKDIGNRNSKTTTVKSKSSNITRNITKTKKVNDTFKRIIRISRKDYERRNYLKQQLRERIHKELNTETTLL